jgi:hypothetical protein
MYHVSNISSGVNYNQRIGQEVRLTRVDCHFEFALADTTNVMRYFLIRWKDTGTPAIADIVDDVTLPWLSFQNLNSLENCDFIADGKVDLHSSNPMESVSFSRGLNNARTRWRAGTNTVDSGHLFLIIVSDSAAVADPQFICRTRVSYTG